jgi:hypothetical protein
MNVENALEKLRKCQNTDVLFQKIYVENQIAYINLQDIEYIYTPEKERVLVLQPSSNVTNKLQVKDAIEKLKDCHPDDVIHGFFITNTDMFCLRSMHNLQIDTITTDVPNEVDILCFVSEFKNLNMN